MAGRITDLILLVTLAGFPGFGLVAQQADEPTRSIEFWVYRVGSGNWSGIMFEHGDKEVDTLQLGKFMKGPIYAYQGPARLKFFREISAPTIDNPHNIARIVIAQVVIPAGVGKGILIFTPSGVNPDSNQEFQVYLIDADRNDFPENSLLVFNATGVLLAGKVGKDTKYFQAGPSEAFSLSSFMDEGIPVAFLVETRAGPRFVFEKDLQYAENRRVILLLEPPRRRGSYKIQATNLIEVVEDE